MKGFRKRFLLCAAVLCAVCGLALSACGEDCTEGHSWDIWVTTTPAGCVTEGQRTRTCTVCGEKETEKIDPLDHSLPANGMVTPATCGAPETVDKICESCGEHVIVENGTALGHDWQTVTQEPTCEADGKTVKSCSRCPAEETETLKKLGHEFEEEFTVDKTPTFSEKGYRSRHCVRYDVCGETKDGEEIPALEASTPVEHSFYIIRNNGENLNADATLTVSGEGVNETVKMKGGVAVINLVPGEYAVRISGLPAGYTAAESYTVGRGEILCELPVTASVISGNLPANVRYAKNSAMYDFTVTTVDGVTLTLSELLKTKKAVVLNFWFVACGWCKTEFPGLESAYQLYKEDIAVIAIDPIDSSDAAIRDYAEKMGLTFHFVRGMANLATAFGVNSYPTTVVIDREGAVGYTHVGALVEFLPNGSVDGTSPARLFGNLFKQFTSDWHAKTAAAAEYEAILPKKED